MKKNNYKHFREEDRKLLRIDLDIKSRKKSLEILSDRLAYMHDLGFFKISNILKIELHKKTGYGVKIFLKKEITFELLIILQLILGSDYRKEVNSMINFYMLKMQYHSRLFNIKIYKDGKIRESKVEDITQIIKSYVLDKDRIKNNN